MNIFISRKKFTIDTNIFINEKNVLFIQFFIKYNKQNNVKTKVVYFSS